MATIGLLVVGTNKYVKFTYPLWESAKRHFMPGHDVTMFVFTNQPDIPAGAVRIEQEHLPWPGPTLKRYKMFHEAREQLSKMDYLFYSDADMLFVDTVGDEALGDLVATVHPGFYDKPRHMYTYERRPESAAYMAPSDGFAYFAGGFNGGKSANFLRMCDILNRGINEDEAKGITAIWHDESHMNRYMFHNMPTNVLTPSYCYPESANIPFRKRLLALDKNHQEMRK